MLRQKNILLLTLITLCMSASVVMAQDFEGILEYKKMKGKSDKSSIEKIYLASDKMRMDDSERQESMIVRLDTENMMVINHKNKTYNEIGFGQIQEGMSQAQKAIEEAKKNMTPEQREMMEKMGVKIPGMTSDADEKAFELEKTGEMKSINGYKCQKYLFKKNLMGKEVQEIWATRDLGSAENFSKIISAMMNSIGGKMLGDMAAISDLDGIPVRSVDKDEVRELTSVKKGGLKAEYFNPPADYTKKEIKGMPGSY